MASVSTLYSAAASFNTCVVFWLGGGKQDGQFNRHAAQHAFLGALPCGPRGLIRVKP
jgi:hypothetical protein